MNDSRPGDAAVLAWCDSIRFAIARDPVREELEMRMQKYAFDFLDSYLEDVFSRPREEPIYELMKTPGKKRDGPNRNKAAVTKSKLASMIIPEEPLLSSMPQVSTKETLHNAAAPPQHESQRPQDEVVHEAHVEDAVRMITSPLTRPMEVDESSANDILVKAAAVVTQQHALQSPHTQEAPTSAESQHLAVDDEGHTPSVVPSELPLGGTTPIDIDDVIDPEATKELSMIAEDDEASIRDIQVVQPAHDTSLPLGSNQDITVPLRDDSSAPTLKRKPSVTQFSGLPAPSPLRKSMRMSREPLAMTGSLVTPPLAHTPGTGLGGKRTSWLTKAKEAKALEMTGPGKRIPARTEKSMPYATSHALIGVDNNLRDEKPGSKDLVGLGVTLPSTSTESLTTASETHEAIPAMLQFEETNTFTLPEKVSSPVTAPPELDMTRMSAHAVFATPLQTMEDLTVPLNDQFSEEDVLHRLKKTVGDLGARAGKSLGKSLGGNAAAALAEARAAAQARVLQRNKDEGENLSVLEVSSANPTTSSNGVEEQPVAIEPSDEESATMAPEPEKGSKKRFSLSELVGAPSTHETAVPQAVVGEILMSSNSDLANVSAASTTPPNSPPVKESIRPAEIHAPIFSKPLPSFSEQASLPTDPNPVPASSGLGKGFSFNLPATTPFSLPSTTSAVGLHTRLSPSSSHQQMAILTSKPTEAKLFSDPVFSKHDAPAWMSDTQIPGFSAQAPQSEHDDGLDDDDSWHMDEKFRSNEAWTPFGFVSNDKDDTMTWSTLPSRSTSQQGGDTGPLERLNVFPEATTSIQGAHRDGGHITSDYDPDLERVQVDISEAGLEMDMDVDDDGMAELGDIVAAGQSTISLVKKPPTDNRPSEMSVASSTSSSQSNVGFFTQAGRFMSSVLGNSKVKPKSDAVKSITLAAAAAKKQQDEADKKAARLKEMENRRQQALQRKAEEEKARAEEEERKIKEENERRKREREETTLKLAKAIKKTEDDTIKRKPVVDTQKKVVSKKPPSKDASTSRSIKPPSATGSSVKTNTTVKSNLTKQTSTTFSSGQTTAGASTNKTISKLPAASMMPKPAVGKGKAKAQDQDDSQPAQFLQNQMADRAKAQMQAALPSRAAPVVASESIELPDINSEYSDSEDEDRPKTFDPPGWAQSPELRQQLENQSRMNPDDIFGRIGPLRMEEIFRTRQSRFRARTSSANWAGADQLTEQEEREYARRMGYK